MTIDSDSAADNNATFIWALKVFEDYLHIEAELNVPNVTELFGDLMRKRFNKFPRIVYGSSKSMTIKFFSWT